MPGTKDQVPAPPTVPPEAPLPLMPSFRVLDTSDTQELPVDRRVWLNQRAKLRRQLETFGDVKSWLDNKPNITSSEFKVLSMVRQEQKVPKHTLISITSPKVRNPNGQKVLKASGELLLFCFQPLCLTKWFAPILQRSKTESPKESV